MDHLALIARNAQLLAEVKAEAAKHMDWAARWGQALDVSQARGNRAPRLDKHGGRGREKRRSKGRLAGPGVGVEACPGPLNSVSPQWGHDGKWDKGEDDD
jgi:hypothetical protein